MKSRTALLAALLMSGCASEQMGIDSLMSKGAQPVTAAEIRTVVVGAEVAGEGNSGGTLFEVARADGSLGGIGVGTQGSFNYFGTWWVSDNGDYCFDRKSNDWPWSMKGCERWYRLGSDYYAVRGGVLQKRSVRKI